MGDDWQIPLTIVVALVSLATMGALYLALRWLERADTETQTLDQALATSAMSSEESASTALKWAVRIGMIGALTFPWVVEVFRDELEADPRLLAMVQPAEVLCLVYSAVFLLLVVHEGGHWFFGSLVGYDVQRFVVGTGPGTFRFKLRGVDCAVGPWLIWGYVTADPSREALRFGNRFIFSIGGLIAELVLIALVVFAIPGGLLFGLGGEAAHQMKFFILVAGGMGIWAGLFPKHVRVEGELTPNDALRIKQAWRNRGKEDEIWAGIQLNKQLNALISEKKYAEAGVLLESWYNAYPKRLDVLKSSVLMFSAAEDWPNTLRTGRKLIAACEPGSPRYVDAVDTVATFALQLGTSSDIAELRPLLAEAVRNDHSPTLLGTLGSTMIELGEIEAGEAFLHTCLARTTAPHDKAIARAYLAKAAMRSGKPEAAAAHLAEITGPGSEHPLVKRALRELGT
jgi:hypothetical protein